MVLQLGLAHNRLLVHAPLSIHDIVHRCSWLSAISTSSFDLFGNKILFLQPSVLVVKDCKHVLLGVFPQLMFFQRLLDLVASSN
jgi:hypothetical protein